MSSIKAISDGNGGYIYPVTIADAIIDPTTGEPISSLGGSDVEYTINNQSADSNGNFTITAASLDAAILGHTHSISEINDLESALASKAATGHQHDVVQSLNVNGSTITGNIRVLGAGNVVTSASGDTITITITPYTTALAQTMQDTASGSTAFRVFIGTTEEWENFKSSITNGQRYMVYIRS